VENPDYRRTLRDEDQIRVRMLRLPLFRTAHDLKCVSVFKAEELNLILARWPGRGYGPRRWP
jgi:hypothetical protein